MTDPRYEYEKSHKAESFGNFAKDFSAPQKGTPAGAPPQADKEHKPPPPAPRETEVTPSFPSEEISQKTISQDTINKQSLFSLFQNMIEYGASDLHLAAGNPPSFRVNGDIMLSSMPPLNNEDLKKALFPLLNKDQYYRFNKTGELDFGIEIKGLARFRVNYFFQHRGIAGVFRFIPQTPMEFEMLGLPQVVKTIAEFKKGLIIVTGPTGSGKTTTLAAMVHHINKNREAHIITIEDPLEFIHVNNKSLITHREIGMHANSFADALKAAVREDPDVILVGEMRDLVTMELALTAAEMGLLVLTTLHTTDSAKSIDRIIEAFPTKQQEQIRIVLSNTLKAVIAQQLVKRRDLNGRIPAVEILINTKGLTSLIREGKTHQIQSVIQTGADVGMCTMDQAYIDLIKKNLIKKESIRNRVTDIKLFERAGIYF